MSTLPSHICFISHNATRSGAPIVLLHLVKWLKANQPCIVEVWFLEGGDLVSDFEKVSKVVLLNEKKGGRLNRLVRSVANRIAGENVFLAQKLKRLGQVDVVVFNTAASFKILPLVRKKEGIRFVAWLHEQQYSIERWYQEHFTKEHLDSMDACVAVSSHTRKFLVEKYGVSGGKIQVIPPFINHQEFRGANKSKIIPAVGKEKPFVVGACGMHLWLKGPDLFLSVAAHVKKMYPEANILFEWIGAEGEMTVGIQYELEKKGLQQAVRFIGPLEDVAECFCRFDLFLLTSREDSFPLVVLEACSIGLPVICFEGIGDVTELVRCNPENVVPYGDTVGVANRISYYDQNRDFLERDGELLKASVIEFDVNHLAPRLYKQIQSCM